MSMFFKKKKKNKNKNKKNKDKAYAKYSMSSDKVFEISQKLTRTNQNNIVELFSYSKK